MALYLWPDPTAPSGKSLLIRAAYGNGLANAEECCCEEDECCCDDLADTLYAKIVHWCNNPIPPGGNFLRTSYVTLTKYTVGDGCACSPSGVAEFCSHKQWHGIFSRQISWFNVDHWEVAEAPIHIRVTCSHLPGDAIRRFAVSVDLYDRLGNSFGTCDHCDNGLSDDCSEPFYASNTSLACDITEMQMKDVPWS